MLRLRIISAIIMIPAVILAILKMPSNYLAFASGLVFILAAWEWVAMTVIESTWIKLFLLLSLVAVAISILAAGFPIQWLMFFSLTWWVCGLVGVCYYPRGNEFWKLLFLQPFVGLVMFVPAWVAFNYLHAGSITGPIWVLLGCFLIWGADIGAYFAGRLFGKQKLAPHVSPKKTWAGFYGAILSGCLIMLAFYFWLEPQLPLIYLLWLAVFTVLFAVIGDLVESMLKRVYGYKDSGKIIPGHGGLYDRIDSMLAAFPIYVLGLQSIQNLSIMQVL